RRRHAYFEEQREKEVSNGKRRVDHERFANASQSPARCKASRRCNADVKNVAKMQSAASNEARVDYSRVNMALLLNSLPPMPAIANRKAANKTKNKNGAAGLRAVAQAVLPSRFGRFRIYGFE